jgi:hypothetical protein
MRKKNYRPQKGGGIFIEPLKKIHIPQEEADLILADLKREFQEAKKRIEKSYQVKITLIDSLTHERVNE